MTAHHRHFVPAAGHAWLLPLYDPLLKLLRADSAKRELIEQARIRAGQRVLDIGCGTGSLAVMLKNSHPDAEIVGLDPDERALELGRRKAARESLEIQFDCAYSDAMPYPDAHFDHLVSSFVFHHLDRETKRGTLGEARRVLKPGGALHLMDFGGSQLRSDGWLARLLHSNEGLADQFEAGLPTLMEEAGFSEVIEAGHSARMFGTIARYRAVSAH
jgi:ubiquinone/menaquinone biosynthesis C-methylase UbiE